MYKLLNLLVIFLIANFAFAKVNVIKSSNSSDDSSIVLQVGTENIQLKEFKSIFYKK